MCTPAEELFIEPMEVYFDPDYSMEQKRQIFLTNQSLQMKTVFKIKLTHRDMYSVVPPTGIINPGERTVVDLVLQPCEWSPAIAEKNKLLIQTIQLLPDDPTSVQDAFALGVPAMDQKVVLHLPPPGAMEAEMEGFAGYEEQPMM